MARRLLVVVLHGAGPYYLEPLLAAGRLPVLARLRDKGTSFVLRSPLPVAAGAWVTMFTGMPMGEHGVIDYVQMDARLYHGTTGRVVRASEYADRTTFAVLSRQGFEIAVIALPMTWPGFPVRGIMISGFPMPDELRPATWPPELADTLPRFALRPLVSLRYEAKKEIRSWIEHHIASVTGYALECWRARRFDAVFACFAVPDIAHHFFWEYDAERVRASMFPVYEEVDRALGRLLEAAGPDDMVIVHSDHGGGPAPHRVFGVNRWLVEQGWLVPRLAHSAALARPLNRVVQWAKRLRLNQRLASVIRGRLRSGVASITQNTALMDWERSAAYGMNFFYPLAGVEVNRRGRQARGIVPPGETAERLLEGISARLAELVDTRTGARVCRSIRPSRELFDGPYIDRFPDLVVELHPDYDARTQLTRAVFEDNGLQWEYPYLGYHAREGIFLMAGPGVAAGRVGPAMEMIDVAPTILAALGVRAPAWMRGTPRYP